MISKDENDCPTAYMAPPLTSINTREYTRFCENGHFSNFESVLFTFTIYLAGFVLSKNLYQNFFPRESNRPMILLLENQDILLVELKIDKTDR